MKKILFVTLAAAVLYCLAPSCSKNNDVTPDEESDSRVDDLMNRVATLEEQAAGMETSISQLQAASLADSIVKKKGAGAFILQAVETKASTKAVTYYNLTVTDPTVGSDSVLTLTVAKGSLPTTFFDGVKPHNARLRISDGNTDRSSAYFPLTAYNPSYPGAPGLPSIRIKGTWWAPVNCGYDAGNSPYGLLYQWGRANGCGYNRPWEAGGPETWFQALATESTTADPAYDKWYKGDATNHDWYSGTSLTKWPMKSSETGYLEGKIANPCPTGWRVPTYDELNALIGDNGTTHTAGGWDSTNKGFWFNGTKSPKSGEGLFLPAAGSRNNEEEYAKQRGTYGYYWLLVIIGQGQK